MKKLLILLFIPLVFTCSSDSSDEESANSEQTIREYLTSNIFKRDGSTNFPEVKEFYKPVLVEGNIYTHYEFRYMYEEYANAKACHTLNDNVWGECYKTMECYDSNMTYVTEDDNQIVFDIGQNVAELVYFKRQGNDWVMQFSGGDDVFYLSSQEELDEYKQAVNNQDCGCYCY